MGCKNCFNETINLANSLNKKVLFDIEDLLIDTKYTDLLPYVQSLSSPEKSLYDDMIIHMGKTLKNCNGAITTTEALAKELKNYVPEIFINHNVASEGMFKLSLDYLKEKSKRKNSEEIIIGYFCDNIANSDIEFAIPAFSKIFREFKNVKLLILGEVELPIFLEEF